MSLLRAAAHILLTGATGLFGGDLAGILVEESDAKIACIVRAESDELAQNRLRHRLAELFDRKGKSTEWRVSAVRGDILEPRLGMSIPSCERLAAETDLIIHCAADTSFLPSSKTSHTNIEGVAEVIAFAKECKKTPPIVFVSTACNAGAISNCSVSEDDGAREDSKHHNTYTHSKAVGEQLLRKSGHPYLVVRPSILLPDGHKEQQRVGQILWVVPVIAQFSGLPIVTGSKLDVVPVSYAVKAMFELLKKKTLKHNTYHLSAGSEYSATTDDWMAFINRYYKKKPPLVAISPETWSPAVQRQYVSTAQQRRIFSALKYYLPFLNMNVTFDNERLVSEVGALINLGLRRAPEYLDSLLDHLTLPLALAESLRP